MGNDFLDGEVELEMTHVIMTGLLKTKWL